MSKTREMSDDERYVREAWEEVYSREGDEEFGWAQVWAIYNVACAIILAETATLPEAWSRARARTDQLRKEIADKQEEIAWLSDGIDVTGDEEPIGQRILAVLESQLAELTRGLRKPEENQ